MQVKLSVVIITFNEEKNIGRCLESIKNVADEIIVIDSFSTDATEEICRSYGAKFIERAWEGYAGAKNFGNAQAQHAYILSMDADEALSETLRKSVTKEKKSGLKGGYSFNRLTNYCGSWIRHSGWYPDRKIRIFPKDGAKWEGELVHEVLKPDPDLEIIKLDGDLLHFSYYTEEEHLKQIEKYTDYSSVKAFKKGQKSNYFKIFYKTAFKFFRDYVLKLGFLDGKAGFIVCRNSAYAKYLKYYKLLKLQNETKVESN